MPTSVPTQNINIQGSHVGLGSMAATPSSFGSPSLRRQSLALSFGSFHSAQMRRPSFFAPFPYSQPSQYSDFGPHASPDTFCSSPRRGDVYERDLEENYCKDFSCCGLTLGDMHALLQHYEEAHVRFEEDEDHDLLAGFTDDDGWSTHSESAPNSPQMGSSKLTYSQNAAAAATVAALTAACSKSTPLSFASSKKKSNGVSLSDIYSEDSTIIPDMAVSAFPNSILRAAAGSQATKKRDLSVFSSSFEAHAPIPKKTSAAHTKATSIHSATAAALTAVSLMGDLQISKANSTETVSSAMNMGAQDELMCTVTGYLEQAVHRGLLPACGEVGSPTYLLAVEELLRKRDEIVSMMESIGRPGAAGADKPYRCTVSGCDKAYKNPNGLKYHNQHGHSTASGSGEDDKSGSKPYRCTFMDCGKCYKNLNGLKYHIEHSHPNLAAALYANISGFANLEGAGATQAAITAAAAIAAVKGDSIMMSAINAIIASAANNGNRPLTTLSEHTPDSSPNASPVLGPVGTISQNPYSVDVTPAVSPVLAKATLPSSTLSIQTSISNGRLGGLMTPASLSPTLTTAPRSSISGSQVSTLTAALSAIAAEQNRAQQI